MRHFLPDELDVDGPFLLVETDELFLDGFLDLDVLGVFLAMLLLMLKC